MPRILMLLSILSTLACADPGKTYSEAQAWELGWPMLAGPFGNFLPARVAVPLADDLLQAKVAWISDDHDLGVAKTGSQTFRSAADVTRRLGREAKDHPGNWANIIIGGGRIYASSFRPAGEFIDGDVKGEQGTFRLDAEDLTFALDPSTGKTLWKSAEPGGIVLSGGKRGGFQVAPAYADGKVFSMGSTGRLFAYDAANGKKLWQADIGPAHQQASKERAKILEAAAEKKWMDPDGPGWHCSLVALDGVLVAPTFVGTRAGPHDTGLRGYDANSGVLKWEIKEGCSRYATPNVWTSGDRAYLLCATLSGVLHLIDPRNGKELWRVTDLGPNYTSLSPSSSHVLVNVATIDDPKAKRVPGYWGCYEISPQGAKLAWKMAQEPPNLIPTWMDACALQRYLLRDGLVYVAPEATKEVERRFLILRESTGEILAQYANHGDEVDRIDGLFYLVNDRLLVRTNANHGPTRGGRHPFVQWQASPAGIRRMDDAVGLSGMDLCDFTNAYEVFMETPIVAGRLFERTIDGRMACYDFRKPDIAMTADLLVSSGTIGLAQGMPLRLWFKGDNSMYGGKCYPPTSKDVALPWGQCRRFAQWERVTSDDGRLSNDGFAGTVMLNFGTHAWPTKLQLKRQGDELAGTWTREVAALTEPVTAQGAVSGKAASPDRIYPTPWLTDKPETNFGPNPPGTTTWVLGLPEVITLGRKPAGITLSLDHDGQKFTRAAATSFNFTQAWDEVDASGLQLKDGKLAGSVIVIPNADWYVSPNPQTKTGIAIQIELDVSNEKGAATGTWKATLGVPHSARGEVHGTLSRGG